MLMDAAAVETQTVSLEARIVMVKMLTLTSLYAPMTRWLHERIL